VPHEAHCPGWRSHRDEGATPKTPLTARRGTTNCAPRSTRVNHQKVEPYPLHQTSTSRGSAGAGLTTLEEENYTGSVPQTRAPLTYTVTVCVSLYTKLSSEMNE
jgi:hypothetical protein